MTDTETDRIDTEANGMIDLKDDIAAAFDALSDDPPSDDPVEPQEEASSNESVPSLAEEDAPEDGRFPSPPPAPQADAAPVAKTADEPDYNQPPEHWAQAEKDQFLAIPEEHREMVMETRKSLERGYQAKFDDIASVKKEHDQLVEVFRPVEHILAANNVDRITGIRTLINAQQQLQTDPVGALTQLVMQHGQNATTVLQGVARNVGVQFPDPETEVDEYMDPQMKTMQDQIDTMSQQHLAQQQITQQQQTADLTTQIQMFAETQNPDGTLKYPHFETLKPKMGQLMQAGLAPSLDEAYSAAAGMTPEIVAERDKARDIANAARTETARKKSVKKAKASSRDVSTRRAPPAPSEGPVPDKVSDSVAAAFDAHNG